MKKLIFIVFILACSQVSAQYDKIITKQNIVYLGRVVRISAETNRCAVQQLDGNIVVVPIDQIAEIHRGGQVLDFTTNIRYRIEKQRPFLPLLALSIGSGIYSVTKFRDYRDNKEKADLALDEIQDEDDSDYTYLNDQSRKDLAWGVISALACVGSTYLALRPVEVRIPVRPFTFSMQPMIYPDRIQFSFSW